LNLHRVTYCALVGMRRSNLLKEQAARRRVGAHDCDPPTGHGEITFDGWREIKHGRYMVERTYELDLARVRGRAAIYRPVHALLLTWNLSGRRPWRTMRQVAYLPVFLNCVVLVYYPALRLDLADRRRFGVVPVYYPARRRVLPSREVTFVQRYNQRHPRA